MFKSIISLKKYLLSLIIRPHKIVVLMYHSISDDGRFFSIIPEAFERQIKFLIKKNFNIISLDNFELGHKNVAITFDDGYEDNYLNVFPLLKKCNIKATIFLVTDLVGEHGYLNWEQINEMKNSGLVEFGCHTLSHPNLTEISEEFLIKELAESKEIIEEKLDKKCLYFSYPKGCFNKDVVKKVKETGFKLAFKVKEGYVGQKELNNKLLILPRLSIDSLTTWWQFLGKISGIQFIKGRI